MNIVRFGLKGPARASFLARREGNAAIEFAIVLPVLVVLIFGIVCYGGYFWMAHNVQELANDAARAAVAGLTDTERQTLAQSEMTAEIANYAVLSPSLANATYSGSSQFFTVSVSYNAASTPFWALGGLLPMPSKTIVRSASIRLGGF